MEWIDGEKGPWAGSEGIDMVSLGLKCSVDQLLNTGLFHADPHRGNLLKEVKITLTYLRMYAIQCISVRTYAYSIYILFYYK